MAPIDDDFGSVYDLAWESLVDEGEKDVAECLSEGEGEDWDGLEPPIKSNESFPNTLVMGNLPKVGSAKITKLQNVIKKMADKYGENTLVMPMNPDAEDESYGMCIVTFTDKEACENATTQLDGMRLDKAHVFKVVTMDKFDEIVNRVDKFSGTHSLQRISRADFRNWLDDEKCREQFLLRYQKETEIYWHDTLQGQPMLYYGGENQKAGGKVWCDWRVHWSPQGSFLATFHAQGIALWAGPEFDKKHRLPHPHVQEVQFSPNEEFILLWNGSHRNSSEEEAVRIFHVLTGRCVRTCRTPQLLPKPDSDFPYFLWSSDDKYIAEMTDSRILVRDTETWELIKDSDGKPSALKFNNLQTFQWSPKGNVLAAWTLEKENNPAKLTLVQIPSRRELASRSRTQCEAVMHWQSEGDFLCLQVTKLTKTGKRVCTNMEIMRVREKQVPVDVVTIEDVVKGFFWESKGRRFAVITSDEQEKNNKLQIYMLGVEKCEQLCSFDLPSSSFNEVVWAPEGQYFIVAAKSVPGGASSSGDLLFAGMTPDNKLEILHKDEHYMLTDVQWDPSSRYVITAVTQPISNDQGGYKYSMEAGYCIWTFQGRNLVRQQKEKLYHVAWRPHPPTLIPQKQQDDIRKNLKKYSKQYDALDERAKDAARQAFRKERDDKIRKFRNILDRLHEWKAEKDEETGWAEAMEEFDEEQGWVQEEEVHEEVLDVAEEFIAGIGGS